MTKQKDFECCDPNGTAEARCGCDCGCCAYPDDFTMSEEDGTDNAGTTLAED